MSAQGSPEPWVCDERSFKPQRGSSIGKPFQGFKGCLLLTQGSRCARTAGLKLANAFGVKIQTEPVPEFCVVCGIER